MIVQRAQRHVGDHLMKNWNGRVLSARGYWRDVTRGDTAKIPLTFESRVKPRCARKATLNPALSACIYTYMYMYVYVCVCVCVYVYVYVDVYVCVYTHMPMYLCIRGRAFGTLLTIASPGRRRKHSA